MINCDTCGKGFKCQSALITHARYHTGQKPFACNVCDKSYSQKSQLKKHKALKHGVENLFYCCECDEVFTDKVELAYHAKTHSVSDHAFTCHDCGKIFMREGDLESHVAVHERDVERDRILKMYDPDSDSEEEEK